MRKLCLLFILLCWPTLGQAEDPAKQGRSQIDAKEAKEIERMMERIKEEEKREKAIEELQQKIAVEIKTLRNHRWAGHYYLGDELNEEFLDIAPQAGFVSVYHGDIGRPDAICGSVEEKDTELRLCFPLSRRQYLHSGLSKTLFPIAWGKRSYLIPAEKIIDFCNDVNEGAEPRWSIYGDYLLLKGGEKKTVTGFPAVPKEYMPYLLSKPIDTEIISVGKPITNSCGGDMKEIIFNVTVKHGRRAGLLPGMELHVIKPCAVGDSIKLKKVEEDRSEGVITRYQFSGIWGLLSLLESHPKVGWKLSTRDPMWTEIHKYDRERSSNK